MISADQPKIFNESLVVGVSSVDDGNMQFGHGNDEETQENRIRFLDELSIEPSQTTLLKVTYGDTTDFTRYAVVDDEHQGEGVLSPSIDLHADGLVVARPDHAILLPLADCIGVVIYDPNDHIMMVSHIGRHSIEMQGALKSIAYLQAEFGSNPANLQVWLSPAVGSESYPLRAFDNRSLHDVAIEQLTSAGVLVGNIEASAIDTAESDRYFSHSEYVAGAGLSDGRFAIVAMMRD
jgi:copper oxidase (laccase) domain-containing protein